MSNGKYKLHHISAIINFLKSLKELLIPIIIILMTRGFNSSNSGGLFWLDFIPILIIIVPMVLFLVSGIIKWWTFVYWFEDNELRVKYGLFVKKKRYIPYDRIQGLNYKEGIFHRIFGLVQVMVETAGSTNGKPEVELTAITKEAAERIEREIRKAKEVVLEEFVSDELEFQSESLTIKKTSSLVIHKMTSKEIVILATTSNSIGVVLAGVAALLSQFSEFIPYELVYKEISTFIKFGFIVVTFTIFVALFMAWIFSVIITFINYYDYTVIEDNDHLVITRGLLEKKRITIPLNRVQAIKIVENPLRQLFGYGTVIVESASGGFGDKEKKVTLFPLISKKELNIPLKDLFTQFEWEHSLKRPLKKSKPFFYRIHILWLIPLIGLCSYFYFPFGLLSFLLVAPIILLGVWQFKTAGYEIKNHQLTLVSRVISRSTFVVEKKRIQAIESKQSYFQKRKRIASIQATVMSGLKGSTAKVNHLNGSDVDLILKWFEKAGSE